jgi:tetratricopeptide (TPR) repeat protein
MSKSAFLPQVILSCVTALALMTISKQTAARTLPEYTAAEARKHTGETATVVGRVDCLDHGRRHTDVLIGGCDLKKTSLWVVVPEEVSATDLDPGQLRGVTIAVTGKIESSGGTPQITIRSASQIVPRTPLNPDYFSSAMEKQSHGDFDGAIADLDRAVELTHEADLYVQRSEVKQKKGDLDGAISDYDQLLEHYPDKGVYYLKRAVLKKKKGDYTGVIADCDRAIELLGRYYTSHPNDHSTFVLAQAYSESGEAKEAMGNAVGAITDYENAIRNDPNAPIYKTKLKHAQVEASQKHGQSFNKNEITPESIAEAFIHAYSGTDVDAVANLYAERVDYTNSGVISNAAIMKQAQEYFARWPVRQWSLAGPVKTTSTGPSQQKVVFSASYDTCNPQTKKHASGIAQETLMVTTYESGAMEIVSQKEQISKRNSGRSDEGRSDYPCLEAAKSEYEASSRDEAARLRYVTKLAQMDAQMTPYIMHNPDLDAKEAYANQAGAIQDELRKHPTPRNVDSRKLSQLLVGEWASPRHVYAFRADGTYGVSDEQRDKWRIEGNEYIDDVSRGPIILVDRNYFIYAFGQGVMVYTRANDSEVERNQSADTNTQNAPAEVNSTSNGKGDKPSDSAIKQKLLGYWKFPKAVCYIAADGKMYVGPRKSETEASRWNVKNGKFYWDNVPYTIVTLTDNKFVFREIGGQEATLTLIRSTKEEVGPD